MTSTRIWLAGMVTVALAGCSSPGAEQRQPAQEAAAHQQAIGRVNEQWLELIRKGDAAAVAKLYTPDGALMAPGAPIAEGEAAIEKSWRGLMATPGFALTFTADRIDVASAGDMAIDRGTYRLSLQGPKGPAVDVGKYVVAWRRIDGQWKVAADIFNSDGAGGG